MFSIPNILTLARIGVVPFVVVCVLLDGDHWRWLALLIYGAACITDYFDGYLARTMNDQSDFGRLLDPIADKVLVGACLLALTAVDAIANWTIIPALVILLREILVSGMREFLAEIRVGMPVSRLSKWKTTIQMLALGFVIIGPSAPTLIPAVMIGEIGLWVAAGLTLITGYDYLQRGLSHATPEAEQARRDAQGHKPRNPAAADSG
jgi:CDP-diacylglycerol--glycerol-3-phosphate 3-phosphatidyltransferase